MKIKYDDKYDTMYIELKSSNFECRTIRLSDEIALNIGPDEILVGIEILDAKKNVGDGMLPKVILENIELQSV
ncbi:MAG: DUF2283 domain-containing protein [Spirochaetia bacterium]|nr:DUF2283 domain-containing protein [Spirochaetia bacterium]